MLPSISRRVPAALPRQPLLLPYSSAHTYAQGRDSQVDALQHSARVWTALQTRPHLLHAQEPYQAGLGETLPQHAARGWLLFVTRRHV
jgi:hypothetical protein